MKTFEFGSVRHDRPVHLGSEFRGHEGEAIKMSTEAVFLAGVIVGIWVTLKFGPFGGGGESCPSGALGGPLAS